MDICLFGLPKSGKTSIIKVIFQKMSPQQTMMLETTQRIETVGANIGALLNFKLYDFAGNFDLNDINPPEISYLENCGAFIFVLDVQNDEKQSYEDALQYLLKTIEFVQKHNTHLLFHLFVHKVDSEKFAVDEKKSDVLYKIKEMVNESLDNNNKGLTIDYHLTSVYDHSLFECFSKVVQKVIKQVPYVTTLLDSLITSCKMEKAFLFDIISKLYIATDSAPVDIANFAICSEMIDVFIDISYIYGQQKKAAPMSYDQKSQAIIKLNDSTILYLKEVQKYIALICIIKESNYDRVFLIDYNIDIFKKGLDQLFKINNKGL